MKREGYDFSGYATKFDIKCSDGRVIKHGAFKDQNGTKIPLVYNHIHDDINSILGYGILEHRDDGEYVYGYLNDTDLAETAKKQLKHGDIDGLSIWANKLKQNGCDVVHGIIREVSLVLAGANPGATIDVVMAHSMDDYSDEEAYIYSNALEINNTISHSDKEDSKEDEESEKSEKGEKEMAKERTVKDVYDEMTDEQKKVVQFLVGSAVEEAKGGAEEDEEDEEEEKEVKHNVFDNEPEQGNNVLSHSEMQAIFEEAKRNGSLKQAWLSHADGDDPEPPTYGISNIDMLFPDYKTLNTPPDFIKRDTDWVQKVMTRVHHTPFARIRSRFADITADEARARGYVKGNRKVEEVFSLLERTTDPQTVYKKQKFDRDDIIDITDFDVIAWVKGEMRLMLDEELARAFLIGDGRVSGSDKISESHIRPVVTDDDLYNVKVPINVPNGASESVIAKAFIRQTIKARKFYKGSGNPALYTTTDMLTDMLLLEDGMGRPLYDTVEKLKTALRVSDIVEVPVMENFEVSITETSGGSTTTTKYPLMGIIVNLNDYNVGADKGGSVNMFDDFDINYNQYLYLIETRCSGALIKPYSALTVYLKEAEPSNP